MHPRVTGVADMRSYVYACVYVYVCVCTPECIHAGNTTNACGARERSAVYVGAACHP